MDSLSLPPPRPLADLFRPRSIAIIGASDQPDRPGEFFLGGLLAAGFEGAIYPIARRGGTMFERTVYPRLADVPDRVDYVISCIPAPSVPDLMRECAAKGVGLVHLFTADFAETARAEALLLEAEVLAVARDHGIRILGPNCMGLYAPRAGVSFRASFPREPGPIGVLSQSGGNAMGIVQLGRAVGLRYSLVVSFGNALDINEAELVGLLAQDPDTQIITGYLEGTRDGRRLFEATKAATARKPVLLIKGGRTGAGARAVASHTASLAGQDRVWDAFFAQTGAIRASSLEDLTDLTLAFRHLGLPAGRRLMIVGGGGGGSVAGADECESAGLTVPPPPAEIADLFAELMPEAGTALGNPVDSSVAGRDADIYDRILTRYAAHSEVDLLVLDADTIFWSGTHQGLARILRLLKTFREVAAKVGKPTVVVLDQRHCPDEWAAELESAIAQTRGAGLPVYPTYARAARALAAVATYAKFRRSLD